MAVRLAIAATIALVGYSAFGQTTRTSPSASPTGSSKSSSFATSPNSPCYSSTNPTSPCYSESGFPTFSAVAPPAVAAPEAVSPNASTGTVLAPSSSHVFTADQAKSRIEAKGYSNVSRPQKFADGSWHSKAIKDGKPVTVILDAQNNIVDY
jgi:hypothetical protein